MSEETNTIQQPDTTHPEDNGAATGKTFTQDEVNRIVSDRLAREREKATQPQEDEREKALKAREARLDCRDYLEGKKYPVELLDVLDGSDVEKFKDTAEKLVKVFPGLASGDMPRVVSSTGGGLPRPSALASAFKPPNI